MARVLLWQCDNCHMESKSESGGWLVVKQFGNSRLDRPLFRSFCGWQCLIDYGIKRQDRAVLTGDADGYTRCQIP
jgi:hypothetical protein